MPTIIKASRSFNLAQAETDELARIQSRRDVVEADITARIIKQQPELEQFLGRAEMKIDRDRVTFTGNAEVDDAASAVKLKSQYIDPQTQRVLLQGKLLSPSEKRRMMQSMGIELDPEPEPGAPTEDPESA